MSQYCPACNVRIAESQRQCPQCGAELAAATEQGFDETQDLAGPVQTRGEGSPLDQLVGRQLHVYHCESLLGRGGMGHVFVARHLQLQRRCALKILSPKASRSEAEYVQRFQHEGQAAAALVHPNITTIHAIGEADGLHFLEMELMAGGTLQHLVGSRGPLSPAAATQLIAEIGRGLAAAHQQQILHRDLKPDNILLTADLHPKIADFGLAKRVSGRHAGPAAMAGTPNYMAPELFAGGDPSLAADVYALGATFFVLLSGHVPYRAGKLVELMHRVQHDPVPRLEQLGVEAPATIEECLARLLAKRPEERLADGADAVAALNVALDELRDLPQLMEQAFQSVPQASWRGRGDDYLVDVQLPGGRGQQVVLQSGQADDGPRLLLIYSVCCHADAKFYESALRLNASLSHGGLAIREIDGQPMFCMVDTYPWATVDPAEIRLSTLEIAEHADAVEQRLTGRDVQ